MITLFDPMHPGAFLKESYLEPLDMNATDLAKKLNVSKSAVSRLLNAQSDLSYEMAIRLAKVFKRSAEDWMSIQTAYGLYHAEKKILDEHEEGLTV
ncbi:HigA family addiction module antitoxin [Vibrio fluvialis]